MNKLRERQQPVVVSKIIQFPLILIIVAFLYSPGMAKSADILSVLEADLAAWNSHDAGKAASYLADNVVYFDATVGKPLYGRAAAKSDIQNFMRAVPNSTWRIVGKPIVDGELVAFEWQYAGTNTGDWRDGTKATGKSFTLQGMSLFRIADGKVVSQKDYYAVLGFLKKLGLM